MRKLLFLLSLVPAIALPAETCWNPFGCAPKTHADCIREAGQAKTEAAAKAMIAECNAPAPVTEKVCREAEAEWVAYLREHGASEWNWPSIDMKQRCRAVFPTMFRPSAWATKSYCQANTARLAEVRAGFNPATRKSKAMEKARIEVPNLVGLSDRDALDFLQPVYYKEMSTAQLAYGALLDGPPDGLDVVDACQALSK